MNTQPAPLADRRKIDIGRDQIADLGGKTKVYHLCEPNNDQCLCGVWHDQRHIKQYDSEKPICKNCLRILNAKYL